MRLEGKKKVSLVGSKRDEKNNNYVSNSVCVFVIWYKKKTFFFLSFEFALLYWCQLLRKEVTFFG